MGMNILVEAKNLDNSIKYLKKLEVELPHKNNVIASQMLKPIHKNMLMLLNLGFYHTNKPSLRSQLKITMTGKGGYIKGPKEAFAVNDGAKGHPIYPKNKKWLKFDWKRLVRSARTGRYGKENLGTVFLRKVKHPGSTKPRATLHFINNAVDLALANDYDKIADAQLTSIKQR